MIVIIACSNAIRDGWGLPIANLRDVLIMSATLFELEVMVKKKKVILTF